MSNVGRRAIYILAVTALLWPLTLNDSRNKSVYWQSVIRDLGGSQAYEVFSTLNDRYTSTADQHKNAHVFGTALFAIEGIDGFPVCDTKYWYGCLHAFVGAFIAESKSDETLLFNVACTNSVADRSAVACQHSIGHGLIVRHGYDHTGLQRALDTCQKIPLDGSTQCYGGAYMEYNLHNLVGDGTLIRAGSDMHEPCRSLPKQYRESCYFWIPQWWREQLGTITTENVGTIVITMSNHCAESGNSELQTSCLRGIGAQIIKAATNAEKRYSFSLEVCERMPPGPVQLGCYDTIAHNASSYVSSPEEHSYLCARVPASFQAQCIQN